MGEAQKLGRRGVLKAGLAVGAVAGTGGWRMAPGNRGGTARTVS